MKFLLAAINAKYIHSNLAVYSLRACAGDRRPLVELGEYTINHLREDILADIYRRRPDVIGFSCYIWNMEYVSWLLGELPKILPGTPVWLGGPEVSYDPEEVLSRYPGVTGVMMGEGEETFRRLLAYYDGEDEALEEIPGIAFRRSDLKQENIEIHPWPALLPMDELAFPYQDLEDFENRIIYYESSRGCPFSCSYCLSSIDKRVRFRSLDLVLPELQFFLDHRVPQVKFVDRTFNCRRGHALAIWRYILEHDNGVTNFHFEITSDLLDEEELSVLSKMRPGLVQLEIGVQTTNPDAICAIERRMDLNRVRENVAAVNGFANIHQHLDLIAGLPCEDYESFGHSFDDVYAMKPSQLQLGFLKVLKGSNMYKRAGRYGIIFQEKPPYEVLYTRWISYGELLRLKDVEEMVEVFYNSAQFRWSMAYLEHFFPRPFQLYEALADYYEKLKYRGLSHSRMARYEHLWGFGLTVLGVDREIFSQILTYDLYLRENVKNRPTFAGGVRVDKERLREFYRREARERRFLPGYEAFDERQLSKMTHMEGFLLDVEQSALAGVAVGEGEYILFDYQNREPLYHNAGVVRLKEDQL